MLKRYLLILPLFFLVVSVGQAASYSTAVSVELDEPSVSPGYIVSLIDGSYQLSNKELDSHMYGVVTDDAALTFEDRTLADKPTHLITSYGETLVKVSGAGGAIKSGEYITSSEIPGIGKKADMSGFVLGIALEDFEGTSAEDVGEVLAFVDIKTAYVESNVRVNLIEAMRGGAMAPFLTPVTSLRYVLAALVVALSFLVGFSNFGKVSGGSVEALGRNPLASKEIKTAVVFNFMLTFGIMLLGVLLAYLILVL